jgi:hypothetical protein
LNAILKDKGDSTKVCLLFANQSEVSFFIYFLFIFI